jgi:hypothetical protein
VKKKDTPWAYRDARWLESIIAVDPDPANSKLIQDWTAGIGRLSIRIRWVGLT